MLVNNLQIKKLHVALLGLFLVAALAVVTIVLRESAVFDLARYTFLTKYQATRIIGLIDQGASIAQIALIVGAGLAGAVARFGIVFLRRYARRYGLRRAALL